MPKLTFFKKKLFQKFTLEKELGVQGIDNQELGVQAKIVINTH